MSFREVVTERVRAMHRQFKESGRMDYRIEKDRKTQFDFLRRNNITRLEGEEGMVQLRVDTEPNLQPT